MENIITDCITATAASGSSWSAISELLVLPPMPKHFNTSISIALLPRDTPWQVMIAIAIFEVAMNNTIGADPEAIAALNRFAFEKTLEYIVTETVTGVALFITDGFIECMKIGADALYYSTAGDTIFYNLDGSARHPGR
jgi:hypothetical protein